jgi:hypothetical protein
LCVQLILKSERGGRRENSLELTFGVPWSVGGDQRLGGGLPGQTNATVDGYTASFTACVAREYGRARPSLIIVANLAASVRGVEIRALA